MNEIETSTPILAESNLHLASFQEFERSGAAAQPAWLLPSRKAAISHFAELGFPTLEQEDWRFTNVAPLVQLPFHKAAADRKQVSSASIAALPLGQIDAQ